MYPDVELDASGVPKQPMSSAVVAAVKTFIDFFRKATPLEAMAAVGEFIAKSEALMYAQLHEEMWQTKVRE
ncbi:hypothetical protein [Ferroacidibacillus organovorans]|uniref:hypothetical protein n=1 Tax=Ferroacidibacillus organovorans TaxID=1765683 RepID=UPI001FD0E216|nr:hypothetical protein [Ferroacidibacillus organovorans]